MSDVLVWQQPDMTSDSHRLIVLRLRPLAHDFVELSKCMNCPYAVDTSEGCGYDC